MTTVVLFHHAQGLTPGVLALAASWRSHGHTVHTPDLYDGRTFAALSEGMAYARQVGFDRLLEAGVSAAAGFPDDVVYAGISLGVMPAQSLAQNRPGARGALLCAACVPPGEFGAWPDGLPAQVHGMSDDPEFAGAGDLDEARSLAAAQSSVEVFVYPGDQHLFVDASLPDFRPDAAALFEARSLEFLARVG